MWNEQRYCGQLQNHVWITNFRGGTEKTTTWSYDMEGHARNVWKDVVSWQTGRLNNLQSINSMHRCSIVKRKKWNLLENCHKYALRSVFEEWTNWVNSVWKDFFWVLWKMDSVQWRKTLDIWQNSSQWLVVIGLWMKTTLTPVRISHGSQMKQKFQKINSNIECAVSLHCQKFRIDTRGQNQCSSCVNEIDLTVSRRAISASDIKTCVGSTSSYWRKDWHIRMECDHPSKNTSNSLYS